MGSLPAEEGQKPFCGRDRTDILEWRIPSQNRHTARQEALAFQNHFLSIQDSHSALWMHVAVSNVRAEIVKSYQKFLWSPQSLLCQCTVSGTSGKQFQYCNQLWCSVPFFSDTRQLLL